MITFQAQSILLEFWTSARTSKYIPITKRCSANSKDWEFDRCLRFQFTRNFSLHFQEEIFDVGVEVQILDSIGNLIFSGRSLGITTGATAHLVSALL